MVGAPRLREAGWFVTGDDRDPVRHLFVRLEELMDGSGVWTLELQECRGRRGEAGRAMRRYNNESDARTALRLVYVLSSHLAPLPGWDPNHAERGRWRVRTCEPSEYELRQRHRAAADGP